MENSKMSSKDRFIAVSRDVIIIFMTLMKLVISKVSSCLGINEKYENLNGKVIVIINHDNTALGKALCADLLKENCQVCITKSTLTRPEKSSETNPADCYECLLDSGNYDEVLQFKEIILSKYGHVDKIIILTPEIQTTNILNAFELDFIEATKKVIKSYLWVAKVFNDQMAERKQGHFINVAPFTGEADALNFVRRAIVGLHKSLYAENYITGNRYIDMTFVKNRFYRGTSQEQELFSKEILEGIKRKSLVVDTKHTDHGGIWVMTKIWATLLSFFIHLVSYVFGLLNPKKQAMSKKNVLITGGGMGIGRQTALNLAKQGCNIFIADVDMKSAEKTVEELKEFGIEAKAYRTDISNPKEVEQLRDDIQKDFGKIDVLINNAGLMPMGAISIARVSTIEKTLDVNLFAHLLTLKYFLPDMLTRNRGHVVTIASLAAVTAVPGGIVYGVAKHGVNGLTKTLACELSKRGKNGISTTLVQPFFIWTRIDLITAIQKSMKSQLIPFQTPESAGKRIAESVVNKERLVIIPNLQGFLMVYKILPLDILAYLLSHYSGIPDPRKDKNLLY